MLPFSNIVWMSLLPFTSSVAPHPLYPFPLSILFLYLFPALLFSFLFSGCAVYFCQPDALKGSLTVTMREVRPTLFFSVPRVWEKIQEKMVQMGRQTTGVKKVTLFISTPFYQSIDIFCRQGLIDTIPSITLSLSIAVSNSWQAFSLLIYWL